MTRSVETTRGCRVKARDSVEDVGLDQIAHEQPLSLIVFESIWLENLSHGRVSLALAACFAKLFHFFTLDLELALVHIVNASHFNVPHDLAKTEGPASELGDASPAADLALKLSHRDGAKMDFTLAL